MEYARNRRTGWRGAGMLWKQIIAQLDIVQSNSMVEAANKILKHQFLHHLNVETTEDLIADLPQILKAYNNRPALCLHGVTPQEVLDGKKPDKDFYKPIKYRLTITDCSQLKS